MPTRTNRLQAVFGTSTTAHGTGPATTGSFTPSANSLLLVVAHAIEVTDAGLEGTSLTISDSAGLTWTSRAATATSPAWSYGIRAWTAPVGGSPASMTVTIDAGASNVQYYRVEVYDFTAYDTTTPIGGTITGSDPDGDGALQLTLSSAPRTDSILMAHLFVGLGGPSGTVTPDAAWTELFDVSLTDWGVVQAQTRTGTTSALVDWADILATGTPFGGAVALALEVRDTAAGGGGPQTIAVGRASEWDTAMPIVAPGIAGDLFLIGDTTLDSLVGGDAAVGGFLNAGAQIIAVNPATETDTAQALVRRKRLTLGQAISTDTAQPLVRRKAAAVGQAVETNTAQPIAERKARTVGQATEVDTAQIISASGNRIVAVGQAVEIDTAQAVARRKTRGVGQASEADTAQPIARRKMRVVGLAVETDSAQPIVTLGDKTIGVGQALEVDTAQPIARTKRRVVQQAVETDTAQAIAALRRRSLLVAQVLEVDTALAIVVPDVRLVGTAVEIDTALAITPFGAVAAVPAPSGSGYPPRDETAARLAAVQTTARPAQRSTSRPRTSNTRRF